MTSSQALSKISCADLSPPSDPQPQVKKELGAIVQGAEGIEANFLRNKEKKQLDVMNSTPNNL